MSNYFKSNKSAKSLYEKFGFREVEQFKSEYNGIPVQAMRMQLNNTIDRSLLSFTPLSEQYANILHQWFDRPHVKEFYYGDGLKNTLDNIKLTLQGENSNGSYIFHHWMALYDNEPFGFLMTSPVMGPYDSQDSYSKWYEPGKKTFTLDLLIGEEKFLGKGFSVPMIEEFILEKYNDVETFIIDPEENNKKAIIVYEKAGFTIVDKITPSFNPKPHLIMMLKVQSLKDKMNSTNV